MADGRRGGLLGRPVDDRGNETREGRDHSPPLALLTTDAVCSTAELGCVPAGVWHNVVNTGSGELKLYSLYSPPEHPDGTVHRTKAEAERAEH